MEKIHSFRICKTDSGNSEFGAAHVYCITCNYIQRQVKKLSRLYTKLTALFSPAKKVSVVEKVIFNDTVLIDPVFSDKQLKLIPVKCYRN